MIENFYNIPKDGQRSQVFFYDMISGGAIQCMQYTHLQNKKLFLYDDAT